MDSTDKYYLAIWRLIGAVVCTIIFSISSCTVYSTHAKKQLVLAGNDPQKVRCLMSLGDAGSGEIAICQSIAQKQ